MASLKILAEATTIFCLRCFAEVENTNSSSDNVINHRERRFCRFTMRTGLQEVEITSEDMHFIIGVKFSLFVLMILLF